MFTKIQFDRDVHGSLYDRGGADSWYSRKPNPHWWPEGTGKGLKITELTEEEISEYMAGYNDNEAIPGAKKEW